MSKKKFDLFGGTPAEGDEQELTAYWSDNVKPAVHDLERELGSYVDAQPVLRQALQEATDENMFRAWAVVLPNVRLQARAFEIGNKVFTQFARLYHHVYDQIPKRKELTLAIFAQCSASLRCMCEALDACVRLDTIKNPQMSNDLSYFRRNAPKFNTDGSLEGLVDKSQKMSLWWAQPTPFLSNLIESLAADCPPGSATGEGLVNVLLLLVCTVSDMVKGGKLEAAQVAMLSRAVASALVLASRAAEHNIFGAKAKPKLKPVFETLAAVQPKPTALLSLISASAAKVRDKDTEPKIQQILA